MKPNFDRVSTEPRSVRRAYTKRELAYMQRDLRNRIVMCEKALQRIDKRIEKAVERTIEDDREVEIVEMLRTQREGVCQMLERDKAKLKD